jgi:gluconolactonase
MPVEIRNDKFRQVVGNDVEIEKLASGFGFCEGATWDKANKRVIFSDMNQDHMRTWTPGKGIATYRKPANRANGNTFDRKGRLHSCEHATSRVVRQEKDGKLTVVASHYGDKELNSPNDLIVKSDGAVYFSDPTYGRVREDVGVIRPLQLDFRGVYRVGGDGAPTQLLAKDFEQPNGLCFSLDEKRLFVNDTFRMHIRMFNVKPDGTLTGGDIWAEAKGEGIGRPDGMKLDSRGNMYCAGPGGIQIFDPDATCLGVILTPERLTNFTFGDDDLQTLYMAGITSLYKLRIKTPGQLTF